MREIKFRGWDKDNEIMLSWKDLMNDSANLQWFFDVHNRLSEPMILMQLTGLKDVNGKEIYEGDILRFKTVAGESFFEVIYEDGCYWFKNKNYEEILRKTKIAVRNLEVIANIYENREMMK